MPRRSPRRAAGIPDVALGGLSNALKRFSSGAAERGRLYARGGHVRQLDLDQSGDGFAATVRGTRTYRCEWIAAAPTWTNACTCPMVRDCKHAYAAACTLLAHALDGALRQRPGSRMSPPHGLAGTPLPPLRVVDLLAEVEDEEDFDDFEDLDDEEFFSDGDTFDPDQEVLDWRSSAGRGLTPLGTAGAGPGTREHLASRGALPIAGRPSTLAALPSVEELFGLLHEARRDARYHLVCNIAVCAQVSPGSLDPWEIVKEEDGDIRCALLAARLGSFARSPLPEAVASWQHSPAAAEKLRQRAEHLLQEQIEQWAQPLGRHYAKRLRAVVRAKQGQGGYLAFELAPLLTSAKLRDDNRTPEQLRALLDEERRNGGVLSPESHALVDWLCTFYFSSAWWSRNETRMGEIERLVLALGHTDLITWQPGPCAEVLRVGGIGEGQPVRLSREGASIEPVCTVADGSARLELRVRLGSGGLCALDEVVHLRSAAAAEASYILASGLIWRVQSEPPYGILEGFRTLRTLQLDPARRMAVLRRLAGTYPALADTLEQHTARVPVRAVFLLDGDTDEDLHVRLLAVPPRGDWHPDLSASENTQDQATATFEFSRAGTWERIDGRPLPAASAGNPWHELAQQAPDVDPDAPVPTGNSPVTIEDTWLVEPDREAVEPATLWLRTLCPDPTGDAWTARVRPPRFEALAGAWEQRPRDAAFFATRRIKRLLADGAAPMPKLDIRASGKDWFAINLAWQVEGQSLSQADIAALLSSDSQFVRLGGGWVRAAARDQMRAAIEILADAGIDSTDDEQRLGLWQLAAAPADTLARLETLGADPSTVAAAQALRSKVESFRGLPRVAVARTFRGELRGYQRDGLDFLCFTSGLGSGAVLADDMGLGKTVQALAWLERLRLAGEVGGEPATLDDRGAAAPTRKRSRKAKAPDSVEPAGPAAAGPALVVCPASVVHNWCEEAARFAPELRVAVLTSGRERHELRASAGKYDLFITNYTLLRLDAEHWSKHALGALILDEAQNVKNPDAAVSKAVRALNARHRLALTGTPLENRTRDLWSIIECVSPGYFGTRKRFEERFGGADITGAERRLLASRLRPIMLRRRKSEVAPDLPPRTEEARRCDLTAEQRRLYLVTLRASKRLVDELGRSGQEGEKARIQILAALTRLRQICCHPGLVDPELAGAGSSKFDLLLEILDPLLEEGHKVLVFSQFARCIQLLAGELTRRKVRHFVLTGATQRRERVVAGFQECQEPAVFLVSLKAGGTGLNLTAASYVVLFDPWWNPAVEAQAIDRTHRIGQTRPVMAYRLVAADTIEEKILELQRDKASLADAVVDDASFGRRLGKQDLAFLLEEA